ncbi:MAG: sodium:proton antiporter [Planctomycetota bacterium]|nr:MAG: sodium:proton antiporter [Planctomycetota bacterium]
MPPFADLFPAALLFAAGRESELRPLLMQLLVIIIAARLGSMVARRLGQPSVVGEIIAGLLLGPSAVGALAPEWSAVVFPVRPDGASGLEASLWGFSQVGLLLLMFLIGLEFDFSHIRSQGRLAAAISLAGITVPFAFGIALATMMVPRLTALGAPESLDTMSFALFMGTALSITAIPILGRMLAEMGLQRSLIGATVIAAAACDDCIGWTLLTAVSAVAEGRSDLWVIVRTLAAAVLVAAVGILVVRPLFLPRLERAVEGEAVGQEPDGGRLPLPSLSLLLSALLVVALVTSWIGISSVFGGFLLGASLSGSARLRGALAGQLSDFVTTFFLPIFFTYTGLRTNIGSLATPEAWGWCLAVLAVAVAGKCGGCTLAARWCGVPAAEATCIGVLMNTRGLMELVVCNVGLDLGVIPQAVYCMLVLMAIITTLMATPLATALLRGGQHEARLIDRGFLRAPG